MYLSRIIRSLKRDRRSPEGALDELHSVDQLRNILDRERARADRSGIGFALLKFTPREEETAQETLLCLAKILKRRLRCTDETGWLGELQMGVVLPCTPAAGARNVADDISQCFGEFTPPHCEVYCYPSDSANQEDHRRNGSVEHRAPQQHVGAMESLFVQPMTMAKRTLDIVGAVVALMLAAPIMLVAAVGVKLTSPGPVFYKQLRAGRGNKPFWMYKFRTMQANADSLKRQLLGQNEMDGPAFKIKADPRITSIGRFLRRSSIDELPQLWHVLTGKMSLVGPRAMAWEESEDCQTWQRRRLDVTPGLTGIWQVYGRARVSFNEWMRMDLQYIDTHSLSKDLKLLTATVPAVLLGDGAY